MDSGTSIGCCWQTPEFSKLKFLDVKDTGRQSYLILRNRHNMFRFMCYKSSRNGFQFDESKKKK